MSMEPQKQKEVGQTPRIKAWLGRKDAAVARRQKLIPQWQENVDYRRGKQFATESDMDRVAVTKDWTATKKKHAMLYSQTPKVRLLSKPGKRKYAPAIDVFGRKVNDTLALGKVGVAMFECMPDAINAAGFAALIVAMEARMALRKIATVPPDVAQAIQAAGGQVPTEDVPVPVNKRFTISRISPADFLCPATFTGSDFEDADWVGRTGRTTWSDAKHRFKLEDEQKPKVTGQDNRTFQDRISGDIDTEQSQELDVVSFTEMFYWRYRFHSDEVCFEAIHQIVFVDGLDTPVIDEEWKGQERSGDTVIGSQKRPIQVLTLAYLSDEAIPPSDSAIARPTVDELIRGRSDQVLQRKSSLPIRWMDVNGIDPQVQQNLLRGTWQGIIPVNGNGDRRIGEVARANYPQEDFKFDDICNRDIAEVWQDGSNTGGPQIRSAEEARNRQQNMQTGQGLERARTVGFFVSTAEVVAGLLSLYGEFDEEDTAALANFDVKKLSNHYVYDVWADSTVLLDAAQQLEQRERFLNLTAKSGYVNVKPVITEMAVLSGQDPAECVIDPPGPPPEKANISLRLTGLEDLLNPLVYAFLAKSGQAPSDEEIEKAKATITKSQGPIAPPPPPQQPGPPPPNAPPLEDAMPAWNTASRIEKRAEDGQ